MSKIFLTKWLFSTIVAISLPGCVSIISADNNSSLPISNPNLQVSSAYLVNPDILALRIETGKTVYTEPMAYKKQPGDKIEPEPEKDVSWLKRQGKDVGVLVGKNRDVLRFLERYEGDRLDTNWADERENYSISSKSDPDYTTAITPIAVDRKSKPTDMARIGRWKFAWPLVHVLYLKLPQPLKPNETYQINFTGNKLEDLSFKYNPNLTYSEAVHVSHLGFRPDDPAKVAFLSLWRGNGGELYYPEGLSFWLVNEKTNQKVYTGKSVISKTAEEIEDKRGRNYNNTDVSFLDFSDFKQPGQYRVCVEGVGCSFSFTIANNTWQEAFIVSARGMYHQRSGIALEKPYTNWERPRDFHPDDGVKIYETTVSLMEGTEGLGLAGIGARQLEENLARDEQGELIEVKNAWGGWHDAGDFDRRIQHLEVSRLFLELVEMFPDYFQTVNLNLPESDNGLPDLMDEALWGVDFFMRLQTPEGGVRGGIENPINNWWGSWQWDVAWAYEPDMWSSFIYAGVAARAAYVIADYDPTRAAKYRESAVRAMNWAEAEYANYDGSRGKLPHRINDQRNLAAAELYRLTGKEKWHDIFIRTTAFTNPKSRVFVHKSHNQEEAAFVYGRTQQDGIKTDIRNNAVNALKRDANWHVNIVKKQYGFKFNKNPWAPLGYGSLGAPNTTVLMRAHYLSGNEDYLKASILASQFRAGANPDNMVYTTGLGHRSPQHPLLIDQRIRGKIPPPGITVYGPLDLQWQKNYWTLKLFRDVTFPDPVDWPTTEGYFDVFLFPAITEFTVQQSIAPTTYTWGYLAARDPDNITTFYGTKRPPRF